MMRRMSLLILLLLMAGTRLYGRSMDKGTYDVEFSAKIDPQASEGGAEQGSAAFGYFVTDGIEVGLRASGLRDEETCASSGELFAEYNFLKNFPWVPFVGGGAGVLYRDYDPEPPAFTPTGPEEKRIVADLLAAEGTTAETTTAATLEAQGGVRYFLIDNLALSGVVVFQWASDDTFADDDHLSSTDVRIEFSLKYFFGSSAGNPQVTD